jgi:tetratricopeptide (TPR) repeat protein
LISVNKKLTIWVVALLLAICAAYSNSFNNGFHFDDFHTVVDNPAIRSLKNVPRFFVDAGTFSVLPANRTYRPIVSASLALDYALGHGYLPFWFHLGTFILFLGLVGLVFLLYEGAMKRAKPSEANAWVALGGAAWFGLHPAMAETVNYVIQRGDLYCTLGSVGAMVTWVRYPHLRRWGIYLFPLAFALLSKPPAAVFPLLLGMYVYFFEAESTEHWRKSLLAAVPSAIVTGLLLWLQAAMTPKSYTPTVLSPWDYRMTQPFVWLRYTGQLFLPLHLNVDTDLGVFNGVNTPAIAGLFFLVVLAAAIWFCSRQRTLYPVAFGLLWFVVTQLPTSLYPLSEVENDHRMFFSFVGLMLATVWAGWLIVEQFHLHSVAIAAVMLALCGYAYGTHRRNAVWHDEETLWLDDVQKSPTNGRGLMIYGLTQMNKGAYPEALSYFEKALLYTPNYPSLEVNLGVVNGAMADKDAGARAGEAEHHFQRAVVLSPNDDTTHAFYGRWLSEHGRIAEAIAQLQTAVGLNPSRMFQREQLIVAYTREGDRVAARNAAQAALAVAPDDTVAKGAVEHPVVQDAAFWINLSLAQYKQGAYEASIASARRALTINPQMAEAYVNIGAGYGSMHQWDEAIRNEREALDINPGLQIAKNNIAMYERGKATGDAKTAADFLNNSLTLNQAGRFEESIEAAHGALKLDPSSALAWNNIAAANEAMHRWDQAIEAANRALALQPDLQIAKNNLAWSISQKNLGIR